MGLMSAAVSARCVAGGGGSVGRGGQGLQSNSLPFWLPSLPFRLHCVYRLIVLHVVPLRYMYCLYCTSQELVTYVNGVPYTRRELEMPAAALHHAGVQAQQVRTAPCMRLACLLLASWALSCLAVTVIGFGRSGFLVSNCVLVISVCAVVDRPSSMVRGAAGARAEHIPLSCLFCLRPAVGFTCDPVVPCLRWSASALTTGACPVFFVIT